MSVLAYDPLPDGSDLNVESTSDALSITASVHEPSERSVRFVRRAAAYRAIPDSLLGVTGTALVIVILAGQLKGRTNLPWVLFPVIAVFVAAIYLLAWKGRVNAGLDCLHQARAKVTVLRATSESLVVIVSGPHGAARQSIEASRILDISPVPMTWREWWAANPRSLRIVLTDADPIDVFPGRDEVELIAIAGMLRRALSVPEKAVLIDHEPDATSP